MAQHMADIDRASSGRSSSSSSKSQMRKKRIEELLASCADDVVKLEQGAAIEVAASDHATRLLLERVSQNTSASSPMLSVGPSLISQQARHDYAVADDIRKVIISGQTIAKQNPKEAWIAPAACDSDTTDPELPKSQLATKLLRALSQDNTVLESNLRDYEVALSSVVEEVLCLRREAHQMENTFGQMSQLRDLLSREMRFTSQLRDQNSRLHRRHLGLLTGIQQVAQTKETEYTSLIHELISENNALRRLSYSAAPLEISDVEARKLDDKNGAPTDSHAQQGSQGATFSSDGVSTTLANYAADVHAEEIHLSGGLRT